MRSAKCRRSPRASAAQQRLRLRLPLCRAADARAGRAGDRRTGRKSAGWPSWAFENHDAPRAISRWVDDAHRDAFARIKMLLLCALRGSIIIYQGEELGLPQVDVPFDRLQDPEAIANWPQTLSRDGARTPMPWSADAPNLGFSTGTPWLPPARRTARSRSTGRSATAARCSHSRAQCLALREAHRALRQGRASSWSKPARSCSCSIEAKAAQASLHLQPVELASALSAVRQALFATGECARRDPRRLCRADRGDGMKSA